jgi:hypothetical protein
MPRKPTITNRSTHSDERRAWQRQAKEAGLQRFLYKASPVARAKLWEAIDTALSPYGPQDSPQEVGDVVAKVVQDVTTQLEQQEKKQELDNQKQVLLQWGDVMFDASFQQFPSDCVGLLGSVRRRQFVGSLRPKLRKTLEEELTGAETLQELKQRVTEWVTVALAKDPTFKRTAVFHQAKQWAIPGALVGAGVALQIPQVQQKLQTVGAWLSPVIKAYEEVLASQKKSEDPSSTPGSSNSEHQ